MKPVVDFSECIRDSPKFREVIENNEADIDQLEIKLEKLVKLCSGMVETGRTYLDAKSLFITGIWELSGYFNGDKFMVDTLNKLIQVFTEMLKYQSILIDQAQRAICKNLTNYVKSDVKAVKESRKCFEKISDEYEVALTRNSQIPRSKLAEYEDHTNTLTAVRSCFQHTGLDYICQISSFQARKRHDISDTLLSLMHAYSTYFHQGSDLFQDVDPFLKNLGGKLTEMRDDTSSLEKHMASRHQLVNDFKKSSVLDVPDCRKAQGVIQEGYLFKRTTNAFKTWHRRWFMIQNNQLVYQKRSKNDGLTVMEEDLKLCTVKNFNELDRRYCFEVLSPTKSHILQADSQEQFDMWFNSIISGINNAIQTFDVHKDFNEKPSHSPKFNTHGSLEQPENNLTNSSANSTNELAMPAGPPPPKPLRVVSTILSLPGNEFCCDCKSEQPQWASINLGITLCIECSGIHRSLGVHVSKVRSLTLDAWDPELLKVMLELGNSIINKIYEGHVRENCVRARPDSNRDGREVWIKAKYVKKEFVVMIPQATNHNNNKILNFDRKTITRWSVHRTNMRKRKLKKLKSEEKNLKDTESETVSETEVELQPSSNQSENTLVMGSGLIPELINELDMENIDLDSSDEFSDNSANVNLDHIKQEEVSEDIENLHPDLLLYRATSVHNIPVMSQALANGADPNWVNNDDNGQRAIHQAILSGSQIACEYLILNGGKFNVSDNNDTTPLHLATELGHVGQVCLLLKRNISQEQRDKDGNYALDIAVNKANADIVTVLRLARLNQQMKDNDDTIGGDETFNEVVKDFAQRAANNPETIKRSTAD